MAGDAVTFGATYLSALPEGDTALEFRFRGDLRDDVHWTADDGAAVELAFSARRSRSRSGRPDQGTLEVYLDGELVDTVDVHGDTRLTQQPLFSRTDLKKGEHTIRLVKASGEVLRVDALTYIAG